MSKFINFLIYLFLFLISCQTRLILRPGVLGGANWEYGIVGIYAAEILLWLIIVFYLWEKKGRIDFKRFSWPVAAFLMFLFFRSLFSSDWLIGIQQVWHLLELSILILIVHERKMNPVNLLFWLIGGLVAQALLGLWQFFSQETFATRWLGLTWHNAWAGGTSVLENTMGRWLRGYGGLPHPNIFGGYMLVGLVLIFCNFHLVAKRRQRIFFLSALSILTAGLFVSFSRSAWLGWVIVLIIFFWQERKNFWPKIITQAVILSIILFFIFAGIFSEVFLNRIQATGRLEQQSQIERISGYNEARLLFKNNFWWGVGPGHYTLASFKSNPTEPVWSFQPVHNVPFLILVELGLVGGMLIILILWNFKKYFFFFSPFLPILLVDHYLWSLWSGLVVIFLLIFWGEIRAEKSS